MSERGEATSWTTTADERRAAERRPAERLGQVRAVADAVLYEGYLLYPYRASAAKNQSRWQFGVLGPPAAAAAAFGEPPSMRTQCLLTAAGPAATVTVRLRFLQVQVRQVEAAGADGGYDPVGSLTVGDTAALTWDEAVQREVTLPALPLAGRTAHDLAVPGGADVEALTGPDGEPVGRIVRTRQPLTARLSTETDADGTGIRLTITVANTTAEPAATKDATAARSLIGAHLLLEAHDAAFVSLVDPPAGLAAAAGRCRQERCWPVLAGAPGRTDVVLAAPIILYDYPEVAEQSPGELYDATEIDEILTLRVMTMTDAEKAEARATDARARAIVDRADTMSAADLQRLHGARRDPGATATPALQGPDVPWWDPAADASVSPETDSVLVAGVPVAKGSLVRLRPTRRADAQDLFLAGQVARVTAVLGDVDGETHVAVVLVDDPAADLHDGYGRYYYFAPDELEPMPEREAVGREAVRKENTP